MQKVFLAFLVLAAVSVSASAARIISINVDEGGGRNPMSVSDVAGANSSIRVGNWNNFTAYSGTKDLPAGVASPVSGSFVYNDGTTVGGAFAASFTGSAGFVAASAETNDALMYVGHYIINSNTGTATMTFSLTDIPFAEYDVYVYLQGQNVSGANFRGGDITRTGDSTTYYFQGGASPDSSGDGYVEMTTTSIPETPVESDIAFGNYISYHNLTGGDESFTINSYLWTDYARAQLYGVQIVEVPEPTTIGLLALGAVVLLCKKRKKTSAHTENVADARPQNT